MLAPHWVYSHAGDQVDLTNAVFPLDTYCTALLHVAQPAKQISSKTVASGQRIGQQEEALDFVHLLT